jgi:hypothetical protein
MIAYKYADKLETHCHDCGGLLAGKIAASTGEEGRWGSYKYDEKGRRKMYHKFSCPRCSGWWCGSGWDYEIDLDATPPSDLAIYAQVERAERKLVRELIKVAVLLGLLFLCPLAIVRLAPHAQEIDWRGAWETLVESATKTVTLRKL